MISLSQSAFLQALGWAIANSLWQMALLWGVYQLCFSIFRQASAAVKTTVATLCLFGGFVWFLSSLTGHYWQVRAGAAHTGILVYMADKPAGAAFPRGYSFPFYINKLLGLVSLYLPYLSFAYLLVLTFLLVRVIKAYRHVQQVRLEGLIKIDARWRIYVQELALRIGITRDVKVWLSEMIDIPATIGYLKPLVLVPVASFSHLSPEQVEAILLHELAHIKRNDYLLNLVVTVVETILFFNPFAQLITRHIKTERENSCDDFVLQFRYNPHEYASALLSLEQRRRAPELAMMASGKTDLLDRIKRIMNVQSRPMNYGQKLVALLITAGILGSLAWLTPAPDAPKITAWKQLSTRKSTGIPDIIVPTVTLQPVTPQPLAPKAGQVRGENPSCAEQQCRKAQENSRKCTLPATPKPVSAPSEPTKLQVFAIPGNPAAGNIFDQGQDDAFVMETDLHLPKLMSGSSRMDQLRTAPFSKETRKSLDSARRILYKLIQEKGLLNEKSMALCREQLHEEDAALSKEELAEKYLAIIDEAKLLQDRQMAFSHDQFGEWNRKTLAFKAPAFKKSTAVKAFRKEADEEDMTGTGIEADQPGWSSEDDAAPVDDPGPKAAVIPAAYISKKVFSAYKERITVSNARYSSSHSSVGYFLQKLAYYGILPENKVLRINKDGKTLLINDKVQPKAVYSLFSSYFTGESVVIIENGEVIQITIN